MLPIKQYKVIVDAITKPFMIFVLQVFIILFCVNHTFGQSSITADGSLGTEVTSDGSNYTITEGTLAGSNQFHSFGEFNISEGESATFTGPVEINNIIGRVTGGNQSRIDGLLKSEIDGADLFLINPSGVLFGPKASLDVKGSFHVSTADFLRLGDEGILYASLSENSVLAMAPPSAFGFMNDSPGGITIQESELIIPEGETFSLIGGDIDIVGSPVDGLFQIVAPGGRINIAGVSSQGEVSFNAPGENPDMIMDLFDSLGDINISELSYIDARGNPGGTIIIRSGNFYLTESIMTAAGQGEIDHPGVAFDINVSDNMIIQAGASNDAEISSSSYGSGNSGDISIEAGHLELTGDPYHTIADIASRVFSSGDSGNIYISADNLVLNEYTIIVTQVFGSGTGGNITLDIGNLEIDGGSSLSFISSSTYDSGNAGNLLVNAKEIDIQGGYDFTGFATQVASGEGRNSSGGSLIVTTETLNLVDGAQLNAGIFSGDGKAGGIEITADDIIISGESPQGYPAGIFTNVAGAWTAGNGGNIIVNVGDLQMSESGQVGAYSESPGNSGNIYLNADKLDVSDGSYLSSVNFGTGLAGEIEIESETISLTGPSSTGYTGISASSGIFASGAGNININTNDLQIVDGAQITSQTTGPGQGGNIVIVSETLDIGGIDPDSTSGAGPNAGIFTSSSVYLDYFDQATGSAGDININVDNLHIHKDGKIGAFSTSQGDGGDIFISAANSIYSDNSSISSAADLASGGHITLEAPEAWLINGALISAESMGLGNAGSININAENLLWIENSRVSTEAAQADGGNIKVSTLETVSLWDSEITTSVGGGSSTVGGNINIDPKFVTLSNSSIIANAYEGTGGNIQITTDSFIADFDSVVDASSERGIDGVVQIDALQKVVTQPVKPLPDTFQSAVTLLREPCIARLTAGKYSSFIVRDRDASPIEPGMLMPSPVLP